MLWTFNISSLVLQEGPVGVNLVKLRYTSAAAHRQVDGSIELTPENLVEPG